jgi:hypothetical protein
MRGERMKYAAALAAVGLGVACAAVLIAASPAAAAPNSPAAAAVKELASIQVTAVNYRRYYRRGSCVRRYYHRRYARSHWIYGYPPTGCENTFPASCSYPYPYFGFVYGWRGIW